MRKIIQGKVYDTNTATEIASDYYWDGQNFQRHGRNTYLYATPRGAFFAHHTTLWQGENDQIEPLSASDARELYDSLHAQDENAYIQFFREPTEAGDDGINFTVRNIPAAIHAKIKEAAEKTGKSMQVLVMQAVSAAFTGTEEKKMTRNAEILTIENAETPVCPACGSTKIAKTNLGDWLCEDCGYLVEETEDD